MRVAVVGTGISGMVSAYLLSENHDITVFEVNDCIGGHTHTVGVAGPDGPLGVDTGSIIFNDRTCLNFIRLLERLGVASKPSDMSFGVRCEDTGLEYAVTSLNALFAQRRNLFRPAFHRMLLDMLRFLRQGRRLVAQPADDISMGRFLDRHGYGTMFREKFLLPMLAAIWSSEPSHTEAFPARHFLRFFENHGLLSICNQPEWRVITGGSSAYVKQLTAPYATRIRLSLPVRSIRRANDAVLLTTSDSSEESFDHVVVATHADEALAMLADPTEREREILSALPFRSNDVVLHTDTSLLPRSRRAWASWNYHCTGQEQGCPMVTYNMNRLQGLDAGKTYCVTLNRRDVINADRILGSYAYEHPLFTAEGLRAQARHGEISGVGRTHYCGAYWGYGFHEDGVKSALAVCRYFGKGLT